MKNYYMYVPKGGHAPIQKGCTTIAYQHKTYQVVFDGELYNQAAIITQLTALQYPKPHSLEECVLFAWLAWESKAITHLEGAYTFGIGDESGTTFCKDPFGLRPLYYLKHPKGVYISNRIETLLKESRYDAILDRSSLMELFAFGPGVSEARTYLKNIYALPMGSLLEVHKGQCHTKVIYHLEAKPHVDDLDTTMQKVHDLMTDSIHQQMAGCDAAFLSGGLDSSIITSVAAAKQSGYHTYSLQYEGNAEHFKGNMYQVSLDDSFIADMCAYTGVSHTTLTMSQRSVCDLLEAAMKAREFPGMADVDSSLLWLSQQASKQEAIILSGECSDEIFGGYPWFYRDELKDLETFPWLRSTKERIKLLHPHYQHLPYEAYIQERYEESLADISFLPTDTKEDRQARIHTVLCLHWFMQTLVTRQVCMGDAANLNIRAPFANVKLLEYVYNIPWEMKFYQQEEKGILRKAFENELPESVAHRKKNPFPKTHHPQYAQLVADKLKKRYDDPGSPLHALFDDDALHTLIESKGESFQLPWYGQLMSGPQLLAYLYQIDRWIIDFDVAIETA